MTTAFEQAPSELCALVVEDFHGAITRVAPTATAYPHREPGYNLLLIAQWADPADTDACIAWARETFDALSPYTADRSYTNYLSADDYDRVRQATAPTSSASSSSSGATTPTTSSTSTTTSTRTADPRCSPISVSNAPGSTASPCACRAAEVGAPPLLWAVTLQRGRAVLPLNADRKRGFREIALHSTRSSWVARCSTGAVEEFARPSGRTNL